MLYLFRNYEKNIHFLKKTLMLKIKIKNICYGLLIQFFIISFISQNLTSSSKKQQVL